jgi:hypothetical protein
MAKLTMAISLGNSRRRKRGETLFPFESFCQPGYPTARGGAFRDNVRALLGLAHLEAGAQGGTRCWSFQLELHRHPPTVVRLFVVEEEVTASPHRQCHLCRHIGRLSLSIGPWERLHAMPSTPDALCNSVYKSIRVNKYINTCHHLFVEEILTTD